MTRDASPMTTDPAFRFDDPAVVADEVVALRRPVLTGFDVDGVLAPIVAHAADAALLPGLLDALGKLGQRTPIGIVSGRDIENLARFGFPDSMLVAGSHGAERRGRALDPLTPAEAARLTRLRTLAERAAREAGPGSWVEVKPTAVVVHVREADATKADRALDALLVAAGGVKGAYVKRGHQMIELACRSASKADAIATMRSEVQAKSVVFVGDDITDEDVFAALGDGDLSVRVGEGATSAQRRIRDPGDVLVFVRHLANSM
jgi:trehalose 6-phosphate phosphatase